jgi:hypothetical protein
MKISSVLFLGVLLTSSAVLATPKNSDLKVVRSVYWPRIVGIKDGGCALIYGEVKNTSAYAQTDIQVRIKFLGNNSDNVGLNLAYSDLNTLNPGESSPFKIVGSKSCPQYDFSVTATRKLKSIDRPLKIVSSKSEFYGNAYRVIGKVKNLAAYKVSDGKIGCIFYTDATKSKIIGATYDFLKVFQAIQPGEIVEYSVFTLDPNQIGRSYSCQTDQK